jgi:hypothetical protein
MSTSSAAAADAASGSAVDPARVKPEPTEASLPGPSSQKRQRTDDGPTAAPPVAVHHVGPSAARFDDGGLSDPYGAELQAGAALLPSFFRVEPYDEMQRRIGEWIRNVSRGHSHIEVRAGSASPWQARQEDAGADQSMLCTAPLLAAPLEPLDGSDRGQDWPDDTPADPATTGSAVRDGSECVRHHPGHTRGL